MKSLDLFAGAGGMTLGFKEAGIVSVGAIEIDRFAAETFAYNFPEIPLYNRDIYSFSDEEILEKFKGVDIICGGPPCQGFSVAGPSQYGIIDKRNSLIMEFFRFIKVLKPKYCILENVKGILNGKMNKKQKALNTYRDELQKIGYYTKVYVLQAADFGVPQYRERVVVIGALDESEIPDEIVGDYVGEENWVKVKEVFGDLPDINAGEGTNDLAKYKTAPMSEYQRYIRNGSTGVTNHVAMKHTKRLIQRFAQIPQGGSLLDVPAEFGQRQRNGNELDVKKRYKTNNQRLHPDKVSNIITASFQSTFVHPYLNRNLTAREGARLQSFPDTFYFCGPRTLMSKSLLKRENREDEIGLSQYNQIGNAVPPRMAFAIARAVLNMEKNMTYDEMISAIEQVNTEQGMAITALPHCSNLLYQLNRKDTGQFTLQDGKKDKTSFFNIVVKAYLKIRLISYDNNDLGEYIKKITEATNEYMNLFWPSKNNPFSHQSDFGSSIIPEMLCIIFNNIIREKGINLEVSAQKDLTIECVFDFSNGGNVRFKNKRVDVAVFKNCRLTLDDKENDFPIPLMAIECKTNLDKNMLSGIEFSVSELKKTFPECCYLVVTELSDFDIKKTNYASSGINEMYVLRKQKRAETRREPYSRFDIHYELVKEIAEILIKGLDDIESNSDSLAQKMQTGKLIGR